MPKRSPKPISRSDAKRLLVRILKMEVGKIRALVRKKNTPAVEVVFGLLVLRAIRSADSKLFRDVMALVL